VRFWDASALVPTFLDEPSSAKVRQWQGTDPGVTIWMMTRVEVVSAIARKKRERPALLGLWDRAIRELHEAALTWIQISDAVATRLQAERIVLEYPLRAADALQIGAAIVAADGDPHSLELVTLDRRLGDAARSEGFRVLGV
jgi:predicted nucleic acid-binding protein